MNQISVRLTTDAPPDTSSTPELGRCSRGNRDTDSKNFYLFTVKQVAAAFNHFFIILLILRCYPRLPQHRKNNEMKSEEQPERININKTTPRLLIKMTHED